MRIHRVAAGESLWKIASNYGTTPTEITNLNELVSSNIVVGQHLLLPGSTPALPSAQAGKKTIEVNGYLIPSGANDAQIIQPIGNDLTYMCIFSYQAKADGTITGQNDEAALAAARSNNIRPLVTLTNFDGNNFNPAIARAVMSDPTIRKRLTANILEVARTKGYHGVNVDFEHMNPSDRPLYNQFIRELGDSLRSNGLSISIAMGPKLSDSPEQSWMGAFDYKTLGQEVDFLMLMTYEWGWTGGPPMAIAPLNQVKGVLNYATSVIDPGKILMGAALYGYDWPLPHTPAAKAASISNYDAQNLAMRQQSEIHWREEWESPFFRYKAHDNKTHEVWFEDAYSILTKMQLVYDMGLRGISYWVLGNKFPQNWHLIRDNFYVKKF